MTYHAAIATLMQHAGWIAVRPTGAIVTLSRKGYVMDLAHRGNQYFRAHAFDVVAEDWNAAAAETLLPAPAPEA